MTKKIKLLTNISGLESKFDSKTLEQDRIEDRLSYITSMGGLDESLLRGILTISVHNESKDEHGQGHLETVLDGKQLKMVQGLFSQSEMMTTSGDYKAGSRNVAVVDIPYTIPFSEESKDEKKDTKKSGGKGGSQAAKSASQGTKSKGKPFSIRFSFFNLKIEESIKLQEKTGKRRKAKLHSLTTLRW